MWLRFRFCSDLRTEAWILGIIQTISGLISLIVSSGCLYSEHVVWHLENIVGRIRGINEPVMYYTETTLEWAEYHFLSVYLRIALTRMFLAITLVVGINLNDLSMIKKFYYIGAAMQVVETHFSVTAYLESHVLNFDTGVILYFAIELMFKFYVLWVVFKLITRMKRLVNMDKANKRWMKYVMETEDGLLYDN